jgi:hypothetical protein
MFIRNKSFVTFVLNRFALFGAIITAVSASNVAAQSRPFLNVSSRAQVLTGQDVVVAGFIITSTATTTKQILIRGLGPSTGVKSALADPTLTLNGPNGPIYFNNNWRDTQESAIQATGLSPSNNLESAILSTLAPGSYTATLAGYNGGTGVGVIEVYDVAGVAPIVNLSSRSQVGTGNNVLIGGMIVGTSTRAVIRAIGPSLAQSGIQGALQDPTLELHDASGTLIGSNDNWQSDSQWPEIQYLGLQPSNSNESAILPTLNPGNYTAIVKGVNSTTGVGLVEMYALEDAAYPRIFQNWANAYNPSNPSEPTLTTVARHDLFWTIPLGFGWNWVDGTGAITEDYHSETVGFVGSVQYPISTLRTLNPSIKIIAEIRHNYASLDTGYDHLPLTDTWWKLLNGQLVPLGPGYPNSYLLDEGNSSLQEHVARRAAAVMATGQFDGIMLDTTPPGTAYLLPLLTAVRSAIGEKGIIIVNANSHQLSSAELSKVNGVFMECGYIETGSPYPNWQTVKAALDYNEIQITRAPKVNCLQDWYSTSPSDPTDIKRMRAITTLSLTHSNGLVNFGRDQYYWYDSFWSNHSLGVPLGVHYPVTSIADRRDFKNGSAIWNAAPNASITVTFPQTRKSLATGQIGTTFTLTGIDGDIYLINY